MADGDKLFSKQMRDSTRDLHTLSDTLVNLKLGVAMSDDRVWTDGLLGFYEIFKYLEGAMDRQNETLIKEFDFPGLRRRDAFEKDLVFYLGSNWKDSYSPSAPVLSYLEHLQQLERDSPLMLIAYIYHLYLALLSGGQIMRKKRSLLEKLWIAEKEGPVGLAVTEFEGTSAGKLKVQIKETLNQMAENFDEDVKSHLLEESRNVFVFNNTIVSSIQGTSSVAFRKILIYSGIFALIAGIIISALRVL